MPSTRKSPATAAERLIRLDDAEALGFARAKVNLSLRVLARRADGYHELESLVAFADIGDQLRLTLGDGIELDVGGRTAAAAGTVSDNLVMKATHALSERVAGLQTGRFRLRKELPVAAGLGGGSADAAAALRLLAQQNGLSFRDPRLTAAAAATGADVLVCLMSQACVMRGIGEILSAPVNLPSLPAVLVNPGVPVATRDVFAAVRPRRDPAFDGENPPNGGDALLAFLRERPNDLQEPAIALAPVIGEVLRDLGAPSGCLFARMSGSGATCFGLFATRDAAQTAAADLRAGHPAWWAQACMLS
jgi:4-diphosphocytidyl-2-C-methyl-D-erythritol kinase